MTILATATLAINGVAFTVHLTVCRQTGEVTAFWPKPPHGERQPWPAFGLGEDLFGLSLLASGRCLRRLYSVTI
jgi:hypothetical protein